MNYIPSSASEMMPASQFGEPMWALATLFPHHHRAGARRDQYRVHSEFREGWEATSLLFPGLSLAVANVFAAGENYSN